MRKAQRQLKALQDKIDAIAFANSALLDFEPNYLAACRDAAEVGYATTYAKLEASWKKHLRRGSTAYIYQDALYAYLWEISRFLELTKK